MRSLRAFLFLCVGLCLGGFSVFAFAAASDYGRSMKLNYPNSGQARPPGWYSAPRYDFASAGAGWGKMRDINTISIGGRHFDVTGGRLFSPQTLAKGAVSFVRFGGPAWLGFMLAGLVWDEVSQRWRNSEVPDEVVGGIACRQAAGISTNGGYAPECDQPGSAALAWFRSGTEGAWAVSKRGTCGHVKTASWMFTARGYNPGTCPAMAEQRDATDLELEDAVYTELVARGMGSDLARRLIEAGYNPPVDGIEIDGPSSIPGDSVTSTTSGPAGTTSTTTNTTHNISYTTNTTNNTSTVTITNVSTTTVTGPDGTTTAETTETAPEGSTEPPPEEKPFCELYPDASACAKLDVPATDPNESEDVTVTLTPTGGFGAEAGSCPPPFPFVVQGRSYQISYSQACDFFSAVRPVVIAAAMLSALLIALGGYKRD